MANKKIDVFFDASVKANVGNLKGIVSKLQNELNNLEMPSGVTKNFEKEIKTLVDELQVFENLAAGGIGNPGDAKKINASWEKISSTLRTITGQVNDLKLAPTNVFSKEVGANINKANKSLDEYLAKIGKIKKENKEHQDALAEKTKIESGLPDLQKDANKKRNDAKKKRTDYENHKDTWERRYKAEYERLDKDKSDKEKALQDKEKEIDDLKYKREKLIDQKVITNKTKTEDFEKEDGKYKNLLEAKEEEYKKAEAAVDEAEKKLSASKRSASGKMGYYTRQVRLHGEGSEEAEKAKTSWELARDAAQNAEKAFNNAKESKDKLFSDIEQLQEAKTVLSELSTAETQVNNLDAAVKAAKANLSSSEAKKFKDKKQKKENEANTAEELAQTLEGKVKQAKDNIAQLEKKLSQIEADGTTEEWSKLVKTFKEITGQDLSKAGRDIKAFEKALEGYKNKELEKAPQTLEKISTTAKKAAGSMSEVGKAVKGATGRFEDLARKQQDMKQFKDSILGFFSIGNTIQIFKNALRDAFDTVKELDAAMTETAVVTDFSIGDMWDKLPEYSKQASALGSSIKDLYSATTLYYQQGLNSEQAMSVGIETMKMARIANMEGAEATRAMTAALRGFNLEINETSAQRINDVYSELAAITAADTQQIATAMTKTASIADSANMEFEVTAALLAQIIETTQEAPETAGTALKTIIARFTEVKEMINEGLLTGQDSEGELIDINKIDVALQSVGISLKDFLRGTKGIDDIFLELAEKWDSLDLATQRYIATTAAGSRQQSRFIAMMSNYDRTMELVNAANDSAGASNEQFNKTLDSLDAKLERLNNAWQEFTMNLANNEVIKLGVDALASFLETINSITEKLSGGNNLIKSFLTLGEVALALKTGSTLFKTVFNGFSGKNGDKPIGSGILQFLDSIFSDKKEKKSNSSIDKLNQFAEVLSKISTIDKKGRIGKAAEKLFSYLPKSVTGDLEPKLVPEHEDLFEKLFGEFIGGSDTFTELFLSGFAGAETYAEVRRRAYEFFKGLGMGELLEKSLKEDLPEEKIGDIIEAIWKEGDTEPLKRILLEPLGQVLDEAQKEVIQLGKILLKFAKLPITKAALATVVVAKKVWDAHNPEVQEQKARDKFDTLKTSITDSKSQLLKFQEDKKNFQELEDRVHNLTRGTFEWKQGVAELNKKAQELKQTYSDLEIAQNDGVFTIDSMSWGASLESQKKIIKNLELSQISAQIEIEEAKSKNYLLDLMEASGGATLFSKFIPKFLSIHPSKFLEKYSSWYFSTQGLHSGQNSLMNDRSTAGASGRAMADMATEVYKAEQEARIQSFVSSSLGESFADRDKELLSTVISKSGLSAVQVDEYGYAHTYQQSIEDALRQQQNVLKGMGISGLRKIYEDEIGLGGEDLDKNALVEAISAQRISKDIEKLAKERSSDLAEISNRELLEELFLKEGENISISTLKEYYQEGKLERRQLQNLFGSEAPKRLGMLEDEFYDVIEKNLQFAQERIKKSRSKATLDLVKYGKSSIEGIVDEAKIVYDLEQKYGDSFYKTFNGIIEQFEKTGDQKLINAGVQGFKDIASVGSIEDVQALEKFVNEINWSNPIEAFSAIKEAAKSSNSAISAYAEALQLSESNFLGAGSQMRYLLNTMGDSGLEKAINEIVAANGEITQTDVLSLAKDYKALDKVLKNTGVSAEGVAKALDLISKGEMSVRSLTNAVAASLAGFSGLYDTINKVLEQIKDWDAGPDEGQVSDFISEISKKGIELAEGGEYGNSQLKKITTFFFGSDYLRDDEGTPLVNDERIKKIEQAQKTLKDFEDGDFSPLFKEMDAVGSADGLTFSYKNGHISIDGYQDKTYEEVQAALGKLIGETSSGFNPELADFITTYIKNISPNLDAYLGEKNLDAGMKAAYDAANKKDEKAYFDESEIATMAQLYGEDKDLIKSKLESYAGENGIKYTNFYDEAGNLKATEEILRNILEIQEEISTTGADAGSNVFDKWAEKAKGAQDGLINIDKFQEELANVGVPENKIDQMTEDMISHLRQKAGNKPITVEVEAPDGSMKELEIGVGQTFEEAYSNFIKKFEAEQFAEIFANGIAGVDFSEWTSSAEEAIKAAESTTITIPADNMDATAAGEKAAQDVQEAFNKANLTGVVSVTTVPTKFKAENGEDGTISIVAAHKDGIVNSPYAHPALVGEEGPELVQTEDGAYLAGINGPEMTNIEKGDTVYTAQQTKKILKGSNHKQVPRFEPGLNNDGVPTPANDGPITADENGGKKDGRGDGKDDSWENSIDKLYNLLREIQEETRYRNSIERRYEQILESLDVSATQLVNLSRQELSQLQEEKQLQEQLIKGRQSQIAEYMQDNQDLAKYAWVEQNERGEDVLRVDWEAINGITDKKLGEDVSKHLSKLEGWVGDIEGAQDSIDEIEDQIFEINQRGKDEYFDLEEKIKDALVQSYQDEIDKLSEINDTINNTNSQIIQSIQDSVSRMRQERENQQTEEDLDTLRQRLSYLQQDTSGANAQEILELQKEIDEKSQDYTDSLIDQKITKLQEQNDDAAEQRKMQIEVMGQQLDHLQKTGEIWTEVQTLMKEGLNPDDGLVRGSKLEEILQKSENFAGLSTLGKMEWLEKTNQLVAQGLGYLYQGRQLENLGLETGSAIQFTDSEGNVLSGELLDGGDVKVGDKVYKDIYQSYDGKYYSLGQVEDYVPKVNDQKPSGDNSDNNGDGSGKGDGGDGQDNKDKDAVKTVTGTKTEEPNTHGYERAEREDQENYDKVWKEDYEEERPKRAELALKADAANEQVLYSNELMNEIIQKEADKKAAEEAAKEAEAKKQAALKAEAEAEKNARQAEANRKNEGGLFAKLFGKKYATGGLADFTGPAWLDGTKSRPEYVLNAQQTKSFFTLVDTLESLKYKPSNNQTENYGDTIYDIDINIETVKEEADVDMLVDKVQKSIVKASQYRNTNLIRR